MSVPNPVGMGIIYFSLNPVLFSKKVTDKQTETQILVIFMSNIHIYSIWELFMPQIGTTYYVVMPV